jgi:hypothetical protein
MAHLSICKIGFRKCSAMPLSPFLTKLSIAVEEKLQTNCSTTYTRLGVKCGFSKILKNLENLKSQKSVKLTASKRTTY